MFWEKKTLKELGKWGWGRYKQYQIFKKKTPHSVKKSNESTGETIITYGNMIIANSGLHLNF